MTQHTRIHTLQTNWINGSWDYEGAAGTSVSPSTGEVVGEYLGAYHFRDYAQGDSDIVRRRDVERAGWSHVDFTKDDYFARPRRVALLRRLASHLDCGLDPARLAAIEQSRELPGAPVRRCGA